VAALVPGVMAYVEEQGEGQRPERIHVLLPYLTQLFGLMVKKAQIPACWKQAKLSPLYKKGPLLQPDSYRMLAVSGTMYRLYANVVRALVTKWCMARGKIPDTQFGFYPGRSTLHPMFVLRHLIQAARPGRLHAAFIDFKQAYDTIPRSSLWQHLERISMPTCLLNVVKDMYDQDCYVLMDGPKTAHVQPNRGVKQGCPLSPLLFSLYINDIGWLADGVPGARTGSEGVHVSHLLYADDLCLLANDPDQLQDMLDRLHSYAPRKHLVVNTAMSEVVHFNTKNQSSVPEFRLGSVVLPSKDSFCYLGMHFTRRHNMRAAADHAVQPFMAAAQRVRQFLRSHALLGRPDTALWLGKVYVVPAGSYASQIWGTPYLRFSRQFDSAVQTCHLSFLKGVLGTKRSATNWCVLRECGHDPLRFNWFRAAARLYNGMLASNSNLLRQVARADCALRFRAERCWTSEFLAALQELEHGATHVEAVLRGEELCTNVLCADLHKQNKRVWDDVGDLDPREHAQQKKAAYHNWMAVPLPERDSQRVSLPIYLCRLYPRHVVQNVSRFRLRAHHLKVESVHWQPGPVVCDKCSCNEVQDEKHVLFYCRDLRVCALREKYAPLFERVFRPLQHFSSQPLPYLRLHHRVDSVDVVEFLQQQDKHLPYFLSELMDIFNLAGNDQQAEQPNTLAEGHPPL